MRVLTSAAQLGDLVHPGRLQRRLCLCNNFDLQRPFGALAASGADRRSHRQGFLLVGYATIFTMAPVFSLVLDEDVSEALAFQFPELYSENQLGRSLSFKTFFTFVSRWRRRRRR